jgi:hypothetical protein
LSRILKVKTMAFLLKKEKVVRGPFCEKGKTINGLFIKKG